MTNNKKMYDVIAILLSVLLVAISATSVFATEGELNNNEVNYVNGTNDTNTVENETNAVDESETKNEANTNDLDTNLNTDSDADEVPERITFTDFSKATYTIQKSETNYTLKINNVTLNTDNSDYIAYITLGDEDVNIKYTSSGYFDTENSNKDYFYLTKTEKDITTPYTKKMIYNGDIYLTILEYRHRNVPEETKNQDKYKIVVNKQKLTRPKQNILTQRITAFFFDDYTSLYNWEFNHDSVKYNIEIGRVTDNDILKGIKNGEANSLEKLLAYAKKATPICKTTIAESNARRADTIFKDFDVIENAYYYSYIYLETENGKYYPVEDIMLYIGKNYTDTNGKYTEFLYNYLDKNFTWNIQESKPETSNNNISVNKVQNTVKNDAPTSITGNLDNTKASGSIPQTGNLDWITIGMLAVIGTAFGIGYYKSKKYSDIK